jgi:hypothetical protein
MKTHALLVLVVVAASAFAASMETAVAHFWVPRYNGAAWGAACLAPSGPRRVTPATCCEQARFFCQAACGLTDIDDAWKNACRANCQSAGNACLQRVQVLPPATGVIPGTRPPASTN